MHRLPAVYEPTVNLTRQSSDKLRCGVEKLSTLKLTPQWIKY